MSSSELVDIVYIMMGGLRLAQMTMLENGWSVQAKKMTDTVGHYRVGRSAAWE